MTNLSIASYNVHDWYDARGRVNIQKVAKLVQQLQPDILCLQEASKRGLVKFLEEVPYHYHVAWARCAILSNHKLEIVNEVPRKKHGPRYVTATVQVTYGDRIQEDVGDELREDGGDGIQEDEGDDIQEDVAAGNEGNNGVSQFSFHLSCIHLGHKLEPARMKELHEIQADLWRLFKRGQPQVWVGDLNSLIREDYTQAEWNEISRVRCNNHWEAPQCDLTQSITKLGFRDCWAAVGRPPPISTCRFNTHIDYVFTNTEMEKTWECSSVAHHPNDDASDHSLVLATLRHKLPFTANPAT